MGLFIGRSEKPFSKKELRMRGVEVRSHIKDKVDRYTAATAVLVALGVTVRQPYAWRERLYRRSTRHIYL